MLFTKVLHQYFDYVSLLHISLKNQNMLDELNFNIFNPYSPVAYNIQGRIAMVFCHLNESHEY